MEQTDSQMVRWNEWYERIGKGRNQGMGENGGMERIVSRGNEGLKQCNTGRNEGNLN